MAVNSARPRHMHRSLAFVCLSHSRRFPLLPLLAVTLCFYQTANARISLLNVPDTINRRQGGLQGLAVASGACCFPVQAGADDKQSRSPWPMTELDNARHKSPGPGWCRVAAEAPDWRWVQAEPVRLTGSNVSPPRLRRATVGVCLGFALTNSMAGPDSSSHLRREQGAVLRQGPRFR